MKPSEHTDHVAQLHWELEVEQRRRYAEGERHQAELFWYRLLVSALAIAAVWGWMR